MRSAWNRVRLGDISSIDYGYTAKASFEEIGPKFLRITDLQNGSVDWSEVPSCEISDVDLRKHKLLDQDIVFARTGATTGKSYLVSEPPEAIAASYLIRLRLNVPKISAKYVSLYFQTDEYWSLISAGISGSAQGGFNASKLADISFPVPSLPEQKRIVAILDEAFAGIAAATANAEKNLANARELFDGYLSSVFDPEKQSVATERLADLVTRLTNGYVGPTRDIYHESGVPYLLARHVKNNHLKFDGRTFISQEFNEKNRKSILKRGDVLLVQSGHIGHSAVVTDEHDAHNCHAMIVITPVPEKITGDFLSLYFNSPVMRRKFEEIRSGSTVPHLTCREVKEMKIPLPDIGAQKRLVERAQEFRIRVHRLEAIYQRKVSALAALKQTILQQAFSGELTALPGAEMQEEAA